MPCFNNRDILKQLGTTQIPSTIVLCYYFNPFFLHFFFFFGQRYILYSNCTFSTNVPFSYVSGSNPEDYNAIYSFCLLTLIQSVIISYCSSYCQKSIFKN